jgi:hypothetical protein
VDCIRNPWIDPRVEVVGGKLGVEPGIAVSFFE